jgi:hypothetical protein
MPTNDEATHAASEINLNILLVSYEGAGDTPQATPEVAAVTDGSVTEAETLTITRRSFAPGDSSTATQSRAGLWS